MSIVVVGLNHKTAPVSLLERLAVNEERLPKALHQLGTFDHVLEGAILSTCNRTEVYSLVSKFHGGAQDLRNFLSEFCHIAPEEFSDHLYTYHDDGALRHLFRVSAGIDSMVVGESEILGQVRRAFQWASDEGQVHKVLGTAFRHALRVGKRARTETAIGRNPISVSSAAVDLARRAFPGHGLTGKKVAIVCAGKMGHLAAKALAAAGASDLTVVNRTEDRGAALAEVFDAESLPMTELAEVIAASDILICSTTAPETIADRRMVGSAMADRGLERPLFIVDIAVPRDVDPEAGRLDGVYLFDIDDLERVVADNRTGRERESTSAERIVEDETRQFLSWQRSQRVVPTIKELRERAQAVAAAEARKTLTLLGDRGAGSEEIILRLADAIVAKLLHKPLMAMKTDEELAAAARRLFDLPDKEPP
jgi:glutamyl-tRNA reductase